MGYQSVVMEDSPLHYWRMDDATSTMQAVVGTPGNHYNSPTLRQPGAVNTATDGSASYAVKYPQGGLNTYSQVSLDLSAYNSLTFEFWLYWTSFVNNDALLLETGADFATSNGVLIDPNGSGAAGTFEFGMGGGGGTSSWIVDFARPSANAWHHYMLSILRSNGTLSAYVDGVNQTLTQFTADIIGYNNFPNTTYNFMCRAGNALFCPSNSMLDEVAIYDNSLWGTGTKRTLANAALAHYNEGALSTLRTQLNNYQTVRAASGISVTERTR